MSYTGLTTREEADEEHELNVIARDTRMEQILKEMEIDKRRKYAIMILRRAIRYVQGYLKDYVLDIQMNFKAKDPYVIIKVKISEEEKL